MSEEKRTEIGEIGEGAGGLVEHQNADEARNRRRDGVDPHQQRAIGLGPADDLVCLHSQQKGIRDR